ncbi:unnamed protein product [Darwinula stevensoni]|uniref:Peptidase M12B domain-containing protein n=1 Tax=Darwinula stevensoni TaxID=69355 RepID=A0A7R8WZB7_9CRUS|nr:unnamed protein product [Darwinula stevensoni]CAG0879880.1 unnamed protein product [Darwinula stevensoni]
MGVDLHLEKIRCGAGLVFTATGLFVLLFLHGLVAGATPKLQHHHVMSKRELRSVFHVESHDEDHFFNSCTLCLHYLGHVRSPDVVMDVLRNPFPRDQRGERACRLQKELSTVYPNRNESPRITRGEDMAMKIASIPMTRKSFVPEYDVVHVRSIRRRKREADSSEEDHILHLRPFGEDMQLRLQRNDDLLRKAKELQMFWADTKEDGHVQYEPVPPEEHGELGELYQDTHREAALLVDRHPQDGSLLLDGTIGTELVIRPAPDSVKRQYSQHHHDEDDDELFLDEQENLVDDVVSPDGFPMKTLRSRKNFTETRRGLHVVFKRSQPDITTDYAWMEPDRIPMNGKPRLKRAAAPYVIYPEILVIVDYDGYILHDGDNRNVKKYFVSFWNGVDLRYKLIEGPQVRISIAGIIISRGRDATPYLERNKVGLDAIDSAAALTDMGKYLFVERRLPTYDIAVAITRYDLCRRRVSGRCTKGTAGFAYVGGACVVNKRLEKVNSVAIVEDTGGFSGIIVAAHEVGHLLGAVHDGSPPPSYLGGPGATKCRWEDGFIMSDLRHTDRGFKWSPCSIEQFDHFLNGDTATCLYNSPHEDESLPRVLPGKLLSLDAQCRKDRGTSACFKDDRVCAQLFCFDAKSGYCVSYRPAAEGSPCGNGQFCLNGRCVLEHENAIPDFTSLTETFDGIDRIGSIGLDVAATHQRPIFVTPTTPVPTQSTTWKNPWNNRWKVSPRPTTASTTTTTTTTTQTTYVPPSSPPTTASSVLPFSRSFPWWNNWRQNHSTAARTTRSTTRITTVTTTTRPASTPTRTPSTTIKYYPAKEPIHEVSQEPKSITNDAPNALDEGEMIMVGLLGDREEKQVVDHVCEHALSANEVSAIFHGVCTYTTHHLVFLTITKKAGHNYLTQSLEIFVGIFGVAKIAFQCVVTLPVAIQK